MINLQSADFFLKMSLNQPSVADYFYNKILFTSFKSLLNLKPDQLMQVQECEVGLRGQWPEPVERPRNFGLWVNLQIEFTFVT